MDKFIKELLLQFSKVILPGFGAIVFENEESGELMFNEHLNYDDGKLAALVEAESNMDAQTSKNTVAKFVRELQHRLNKGETYEIYQLGAFSKNEDGEYVFAGNIKTGVGAEPTVKAEPVASEPVDMKEVDDKELTDEVEEESSTDSSVVAMFSQGISGMSDEAEKKADELTKETTKESIKKEEVQQEKVAKKEMVPEPKVVPPTPPVEKEVVKEESKPAVPKKDTPVKKETPIKKEQKAKKKEAKKVKPVAEAPTKKKDESVKEARKKRSPFFWILLIILILVGCSAIYGAFNYDKVKELMGWDKFEEVTPSDTPTEQVAPTEEAEANSEEAMEEPEEDITNEEVQEEEPAVAEETPTPVATSNGSYHIIVGGFSDPSNADKLVEELRGKGLDAKVVHSNGSLTQVSAQSYATLEEAKANISSIKEKSGVSGWILKK